MRAARAQINRALPRIMEIVEAGNRPADTLRNIFSTQYTDGRYQEILDVVDMAIGVYDANLVGAWARTVNPFYYVMTALAFLAGLPRRALVAIGLIPPWDARNRLGRQAGSDAALARLVSMEQLIETRLADLREWQSRAFSENANQMTDLAERMDFLERMLAQQRPAQRLQPGEEKVVTPH